MNDHTPQDERLKLQAFADGELSLNEQGELLQQMSDDPKIAQQVLHQRQLKEACARAQKADSAQCPAELRELVTAMFDEPARDAEPSPAVGQISASDASPVIGFIGRWAPAAVAAVLLISTVFVWVNISGNQANGNAALLPASMVNQLTGRHVHCAMDPANSLHGDHDLVVNEVGELSSVLAQRFDATGVAGLDLSAIGCEFDAVGPCSIPGENAVHLIYHDTLNNNQSLSLWIRPYDPTGARPTPALEDNRVYTIQQDDNPPVILWRQGELVYYLTGDGPVREEIQTSLREAI